ALITLDLFYNKITDAGVKYLTSALLNNTTLTTLDLGCNGIHDDGAHHLASALQNNRVSVILYETI
ncbi:unnamed protein product, partial [Rotaria magnacalcarata]